MASATEPTVYPAWLAHGERQAERLTVKWEATVACMKFDPEPCAVLDITHLGCRLQLSRDVTVGTYITVRVPDFANIEGWVAWSKAQQIGVDFSHPLPAAIVSEIMARMKAGLPH